MAEGGVVDGKEGKLSWGHGYVVPSRHDILLRRISCVGSGTFDQRPERLASRTWTNCKEIDLEAVQLKPIVVYGLRYCSFRPNPDRHAFCPLCWLQSKDATTIATRRA